MFKRVGATKPTAAPAASESAPAADPSRLVLHHSRDTSETRRAAQNDLLAGIGDAIETNLGLGKILRDSFALVDELASFSAEFDDTAEMTRSRADIFVASVAVLQKQSELIEDRLVSASAALASAQDQSRSALTSVEDLTTSINGIERVVKMIAEIASQTNLLALNATIEAARAGAAGAGFRVVASEVKALSQQTQHATDEIVESVKRIRARAQVNTKDVKDFGQTIAIIDDVFNTVRTSILAQGEQTREIGSGSDELSRLAQKVRSSAGRMQSLGGTVKSMTELAEKAAGTARCAFSTLTDRAAIILRHGDGDERQDVSRWPVVIPGTLTVGERQMRIRTIDLSKDAIQIETGTDALGDRLGDTVAVQLDGLGQFDVRLLTPTASGYETLLVDPPAQVLGRIDDQVAKLHDRYRPYIDRVRSVASRAGEILEQAVTAGTVSPRDLFDTTYRRDGSTEPAQYMNAAVAPMEVCIRALIENELLVSPRPDFCFAQDRNGFCVIHNLIYSHPARSGDLLWNIRHSRIRRIFDDRAGMAASRNLKPFLVQSYARDMGDAIEIRMEFDAPVFVCGRHWGAIRMAYRLVENSAAEDPWIMGASGAD